MTRSLVVFFLLLASLVSAAPAKVFNEDVRVRFGATDKVFNGRIKLTFGPDKPIARWALRVTGQSSGRSRVVFEKAWEAGVPDPLAANATRTVSWPQTEEQVDYAVQIRVWTPRRIRVESAWAFHATAARPFNLQVKEIDMEGARMVVVPSTDVSKIKVFIKDGRGRLAAQEFQDLTANPLRAHAESVISWKAVDLPGGVQNVKLMLTDEFGSWQEHLIRFDEIRVPHEDVTFDSGQADILPGEEAKLAVSLARIQEQIKLHDAMPLRLYVAGHTDTVDSAEYNQTLSNQRARAIAGWFRARGLGVPIWFQGFGESRLLIPTPDDKAEPRNRRAEYILALDHPRGYPRAWRAY